MTDDLLTWRPEFPILERTTYLVSHSLGAMPRGVYDRLKEYADIWSARGVKAWAEGWWEMPVDAGNIIADMINARTGEVSIHPNVTLMQAVILSCFDDGSLRRGRRKIVCEEMNFPSVLYLLQDWAETHGAHLDTVPSDDGITVDTQRLCEAIDEDTFLVPISHVLFKSAYIQDASAIIEKAHRVGAIVVLDAYQSIGVLPVDVQELGVDILVGGSVKWLCGGPGAAFLYVRPDLRKRLRPRLTGWVAHRDPFGFNTGPMDQREDGFRFLNGTPSIPSMYAAAEGARIVREAGVERIREKSLRQTSLLIACADSKGFAVRTPREHLRRGGTVTIDVDHGLEVSRALIDRGIVVDYRKGAGIRIAPHFYTTDAEVRAAVDALEDIVETRTWERFVSSSGLVT